MRKTVSLVLAICGTLRHPEMLVAHLGNYGELVLRVLADAAAENPAFTLNVQ